MLKDIGLWSIFIYFLWEKNIINFLTIFYISRRSDNKTFIKYFINIFPKAPVN